jgi:cytoskeletal protein CcmA (bactofilin family)
MQGDEELSLVGKSVRITGEIFCGQDLVVEGEVDGTVTLPDHKLTIGPQANVKAAIQAQDVVVVGVAEGTIEAQRVELCSHSHLVGDIKTPRISIKDGAHFQGTIEVTRPASTITAPLPAGCG